VTATDAPATRRDAMRGDIATVAARLFAERGYAATTMADIAECFGFTKGALYNYVASKEEVLGLIADRALGLLESGLERSRAEHETVAEQLLATVRHHVDVASHDTRCLFVLEAIRGERTDDQRAVLRRRSERYQRGLARLIADGQRSGELDADLDPHLSALAVIGMCSWVAWWFDPAGKASPDRIARVFGLLCAGGLLASDHELRHAEGDG
jgi:AcrR family transcriptional regulator